MGEEIVQFDVGNVGGGLELRDHRGLGELGPKPVSLQYLLGHRVQSAQHLRLFRRDQDRVVLEGELRELCPLPGSRLGELVPESLPLDPQDCLVGRVPAKDDFEHAGVVQCLAWKGETPNGRKDSLRRLEVPRVC